MAVSPNTTRSPSTPATKSEKNKKSTLVVILRVPKSFLKQLDPSSAQEEEQVTPSLASSPAPVIEDASILKTTDSNDNGSESNATPAPTNGEDTPSDPSKKRKAPGGSSKKSPGSGVEISGLPKPRGKPGPKKKLRLDDGTVDHATAKPATGMIAGIPHKLGPKANQGAINAGLRALDRTGKPCRKWIKKPFQLKSFTGIVWDVPSWKGNERQQMLNGQDPNAVQDISLPDSSDVKPNESDTAVDSNVGEQPDPMVLSTPAASSPVPVPESEPTSSMPNGESTPQLVSVS